MPDYHRLERIYDHFDQQALDMSDSLAKKLCRAEDVKQYVRARFKGGIFIMPLMTPLPALPQSEDLSRVVIENCQEELGLSGYSLRPHQEERVILASALGIKMEGNQLSPELYQALKMGHIGFLLGMLAFTEHSIPVEYKVLKDRLEQFFPDLEERSMLYLSDHIQHDVYHSDALKKALRPIWDQADIGWRGKFIQGADFIIEQRENLQAVLEGGER